MRVISVAAAAEVGLSQDHIASRENTKACSRGVGPSASEEADSRETPRSVSTIPPALLLVALPMPTYAQALWQSFN